MILLPGNNGEIYSGITDPISIEIHPSIYKSDFNATFTSATITVYLPIELELEVQKNDKIPESLTPTQEAIDNKIYNKYIYKYDEDDIKYGDQISGIDTLILHAYVDISTKDNTDVKIISTMDAVVKSNNDAAQEYNSYIPDEYRKNELL